MSEKEAVKVDSRESSFLDFVEIAHRDLFYKTEVFAYALDDARSRGFETYLSRVHEYTQGSALVDSENRSFTKRVVLMCSADYLGLACHRAVVRAAQQATDRFGTSVSSVP